MNTYVCLRCSRKLLRWNCQRRSSAFVSPGQLVRRNNYSRATLRDTLLPGESAVAGCLNRNRALTFAQEAQKKQNPKIVDQFLETLFASNRQEEQVVQKSRSSRSPNVPSAKTALKEKSAIERSMKDRFRGLENKMLRRTVSLKEIWNDCEGLLGESEWIFKESGIRSDDTALVDNSNISAETQASSHIFHSILIAICQEQRLVINGRIITPADVIKLYLKHGVMMKIWWSEVVFHQLGHLLRLSYQSADGAMGSIAKHRRRILSFEILDVWAVYMEKHGLKSSKPPQDTRVAAEMTTKYLDVTRQTTAPHFMRLFNSLGRMQTEEIRPIATRSLQNAGVSSEIIEKALEGLGNCDSRSSSKLDWSETGQPARFQELTQAVARSDTESALHLWRRFKADLHAVKSVGKLDQIERFYVRFLESFWALRRQEQAIEVWNHMLNSGRVPNQKHWNVMLVGCIKAQDVRSLRSIWTNMLGSGMKPDAANWLAYIQGLLECRQCEEGLHALEKLGQLWALTSPNIAANKMMENKTEQRNDDSVLRPNTKVINAALSALIHIKRRDLIPRVLAWAKSHEIPSDIYTFNILLRPLARDFSRDAILAHLQQMDNANCTPDTATFTIILNGLVSNPTFRTLPPQAQEDTVTSILAEMDRRSIVPSWHTYATLLDGLLVPGSSIRPPSSHDVTPNIPAARTILAHMAARNIRPSPHIYTILITHYFTRRPSPDLPAISALWSSISLSGQAHRLDNIFFDRIIEGYADHNKIAEAWKFLKMMPEQGKSPGWRALSRVLRALVGAEEWELCRVLVEDVETEGGLLRCGQGKVGARERAEFWELVDELRGSGLCWGNEG
ncbi:hypothetical protein BDR22DRAFT_854554 [Usnea florida]